MKAFKSYLLLMAVSSVKGESDDAPRVCATTLMSSYQDNDSYVVHDTQASDNKDKPQMTCNNGTDACFALWEEVQGPDNTTSVVIKARGCWEASGKYCPPVCQPMNPSTVRTAGLFCCCTGNMCNMNITYSPIFDSPQVDKEMSLSTIPTPTRLPSEGSGRKVLLLSGCGALIFVIAFAALAYKWGPTSKSKNGDAKNTQSLLQELPTNNSYSMKNISLEQIVGQGKYGTVWMGKTRDQQVAVKIFPSHYNHYFYNEKDIYSLPFMDHPSLLHFYGHDETVNKDGGISRVLVLSFCPLGTLQDYLKTHTLDLTTFIKMTLSFTSALAHLHTEIHKHDKWKPCITHRDVNTRNILVKDDLSCCLADLGLAVKITGSHYYTLNEEQHAETKSINDVGTLRYMAPEVLEGAVNLRDCESSLKQIDVYALGLVLWEMSMRVHDLYHRPSDVPPYSLPFEKEIGIHPSLEEMQVLVCRNKARPLFPAEWKNTAVTRTLRETVDDCTDQDGEARLTALCVHERITLLQKGTTFGGVSPSLHQSNFPTTAFNISNINNNNVYAPDLSASERETADGCVSEGTIETIVTMSPSEPCPTHFNSGPTRDVAMIQPHQGRNPCLERNLLSCSSSEELYVVQTSNKHKREFKGCEEAECLVRCSAPHAAIPFVQNFPLVVPKQLNLPVKSDSGGIVASIFRLLRRKDESAVKATPSLTNVIVSPFEKPTVSPAPPRRPSSLQLLSPIPPQEDATEEKRLKELSTRIRTPGDLPASVRRQRGNKARLSLYDDRIMSNTSAADSTF